MSVNSLVFEIIKNLISVGFIFHLLIDLFIGSIITPFINAKSTEHFIGNKIPSGVNFVIISIIIEIIIIIHGRLYFNKYKNSFKNKINGMVEHIIANHIVKLKWNAIRNLKKDNIEKIKSDFKWPLVNFISTLVCNTITILPIFGYIAYLIYLSPIPILLFFIGILLIIKFYPMVKRESDAYWEIWTRYNFLQEGLFTQIIHQREQQSVNEIVETMNELEERRSVDRIESTNYYDVLNIIFNVILIVGLYFFVGNISSASDVIVYITFYMLLRGKFLQIVNLCRSYDEVKIEYEKIDKILFKLQKKDFIPQIKNFDKMTIKQLKYSYPQKDINQEPYTVQTINELCAKKGECIRLVGESGNGKSTFMDLLTGIIPSSECKICNVEFDDEFNQYGFGSIEQIRQYVEQSESINWKACVFEIITNDKYVENHSNIDLIWEALMMAQCDDFLKKDNKVNTHKSIKTPNIDPSIGQKKRIVIARALYYLLLNQHNHKFKGHPKTKMLVLDEIDSAFQGDMAIKIMKIIFDFCKENDIICIVSAHTTEVKNMKYDQVWKVENGMIGPKN